MDCCLADIISVMCEQIQQQSEVKYDVRLCVEEAGLIVTRLTAPTTTCNITLTSPILREHLVAASPGTTDCVAALIIYWTAVRICCICSVYFDVLHFIVTFEIADKACVKENTCSSKGLKCLCWFDIVGRASRMTSVPQHSWGLSNWTNWIADRLRRWMGDFCQCDFSGCTENTN